MQSTFKSLILAFSLLALSPLAVTAGEADVVDVDVRKTGASTYSFSVSVRHDDAGWKHYANWWEVVDQDGKVLGKRVLLHPHVNEQPFRRSLSGVKIPKTINKVNVRAHDLVHGYGGAVKLVALPK